MNPTPQYKRSIISDNTNEIPAAAYRQRDGAAGGRGRGRRARGGAAISEGRRPGAADRGARARRSSLLASCRRAAPAGPYRNSPISVQTTGKAKATIINSRSIFYKYDTVLHRLGKPNKHDGRSLSFGVGKDRRGGGEFDARRRRNNNHKIKRSPHPYHCFVYMRRGSENVTTSPYTGLRTLTSRREKIPTEGNEIEGRGEEEVASEGAGQTPLRAEGAPAPPRRRFRLLAFSKYLAKSRRQADDQQVHPGSQRHDQVHCAVVHPRLLPCRHNY
ncbi:hypothetical protein EVAR_60040_1 [Eumeta japonica]|uniref:Uncharacterized protein n=1 Tax=Eumeta variegata TaxID=151549 RepID=A0A4C1YTP9_EUMVA|nr:hypothetical protein EVAR_60040_1 [Eumeta japonica]